MFWIMIAGLFIALTGIMLYRIRERFYRKSWSNAYDAISAWIIAIGVIIIMSFGIGLACSHADYNREIHKTKDYKLDLERYERCPAILNCASKVEIEQKVRKYNERIKVMKDNLDSWFWSSATPSEIETMDFLHPTFLDECGTTESSDF